MVHACDATFGKLVSGASHGQDIQLRNPSGFGLPQHERERIGHLLGPEETLAPMQNTPALEAAAIDQIPATLAAYEANYRLVLDQVRALAPNANLALLGYFNPSPAELGRQAKT